MELSLDNCKMTIKYHNFDMKLIGLHGHLQSAKRFKGQTNALMRHLKKMGVEVIFIDAPFICPDGPEDSPFRTWIGDNSIELSKKA